jgi:DNA repair exonuclease SbcCD ATPase subunit
MSNAKNLQAQIQKLSKDLVEAEHNLKVAESDPDTDEETTMKLEDIVQDIQDALYDAQEDLDRLYAPDAYSDDSY